MSKSNVLIQLDPDPHASSFDAVVAIDAAVAQILQYHNVQRADVQTLVHGALFTRGPDELRHTAIFIGGSNVAASEAVLREVTSTFFGPMRVSVMLDPNGANTTAAAAVLAAARHLPLDSTTATVLAATGPVGQRAARLLARAGAQVRVTSRRAERAQAIGDAIMSQYPDSGVRAMQVTTPAEASEAVRGSQLVIAAGATSTQLLARDGWAGDDTIRVIVDLNAVPPTGVEGVAPADRAAEKDDTICYGAIGVGGLKMKIHKQALRTLFERNDQVLDAEQICDLGKTIE